MRLAQNTKSACPTHLVEPRADSPCGFREYLPELQRAREAREKSLKDLKDDSLSRFMKDLAVDRAQNPAAAAADRWEEEEDEDADDDMDMNIIDRSGCRPLLPFVRSKLTVVPARSGEDAWPGQYIDVTRMRPRNDEGMAWPRPG